MTFHTREQAENLIEDLEVIYFKEKKKDDKTAKDDMKHWHEFHIIAKKNELYLSLGTKRYARRGSFPLKHIQGN